MKHDEYIQILRDSQAITLRNELTSLQSKAHDYVIQQMKLMECKYKEQLLSIVEQYEDCKLICEQLKLKNEQYSKLILEQEFKSIQTKNYVSLEIVNQLLTQKINSLLLQLKNHNIISESEYHAQRNMLQKNIAEVFLNYDEQPQPVFLVPNTQNSKPIQIPQQTIKYETQSSIHNQNQIKVNKYFSISTQTELAKKKKEKPVKQSKQQIQEQQSITIDLSRELFECKKSIQELQKSKIDLQITNDQLKSQNQKLLSRLNKKQPTLIKCNQVAMKNSYTPQIIKKFIKFDDILFKNVRPFKMAESFDLRQGNLSSRQFFTRPNTSAPNTARNRLNQTQQPSILGYQVLL
ncbi:unnamed protein product (macronuclear) [Paramecium tetraurelia]|uniref:Uncharacterized protein n=1 Tax=Paramecium tetraurelia TaxID=5888 RepID=A0CG88_PARTE|nr:uncharacterized protein GSPATT00038250001 [Paramecium tetraurelia]CAK69805.1 unnamed protein product [Paramecium tetraurelia]|eukprot:XP_001437202.1 hypothetical protein (macronuclear) [Paramecium tetraurelia strain d4-2]